MAIVMTPIFTQTVGASGAATVNFNNIPQIYTDLQLVVSARRDSSTGTGAMTIQFNGVTTGYSSTWLYGVSDGTYASIRVAYLQAGQVGNANQTANTFMSNNIYIPNYTSSNFKSAIVDSVMEGNQLTAFLMLNSGLWSNTAAITSISIFPQQSGSNFTQYTTASLYGIIRNGA